MDDDLKAAIEQMKQGSEQGFNEIYTKTYNRVYFRARQIMKKEEDAQDLTQIVFVEAYKSIGSLTAPEALYNWLDGITYRQGMKIFRKQREVLLTEDAQIMFDELESNDLSSIPELTADQKATSEIIKQIIEELPELQRTAVIMYYYDGMKVEKIADYMECSVNTVKSRLNYARKFIKDKVEEKEKQEGYKLHVFGLPVVWFAIQLMASRTKLTAQAAQAIYNGACESVGLQAMTLGSASFAGTSATVTGAGAAATATSLSVAAKALIVAGAIAVIGAGSVGAVALMNHNSSKELIAVPEETADEPVETEPEEKEEIPVEDAEETAEEDIVQTPEYDLTDAVGRQISALVGVMGSQNPGTMTDDELLTLIDDYVYYVTYQVYGMPEAAADDLPYDWVNRNVSEDEVRTFVKDGLGQEFSDSYSFSAALDYRYIAIQDGKLTGEWDGPTEQLVGGSAQVDDSVQSEDGTIVVAGTYTYYDEMAEGTERNYRITCIPTGNMDVLGGLQIVSLDAEDISQTDDSQTTLADMDLTGYQVLWAEGDDEIDRLGSYALYFQHSDTPLYFRQITQPSYDSEGWMVSHGEYEGYFTLDGQELHFYVNFPGETLEQMTLTDLDGNPVDKWVICYVDFSYDTPAKMQFDIYLDVPNISDWREEYRGWPAYEYTE
jgi:RNA polymerase sigma factor (sigma-70 family)